MDWMGLTTSEAIIIEWRGLRTRLRAIVGLAEIGISHLADSPSLPGAS